MSPGYTEGPEDAWEKAESYMRATILHHTVLTVKRLVTIYIYPGERFRPIPLAIYNYVTILAKTRHSMQKFVRFLSFDV